MNAYKLKVPMEIGIESKRLDLGIDILSLIQVGR